MKKGEGNGVRNEKENETPEIDASKFDGTDGKVTMKKDGVSRRFHFTKIEAMKADGWELVG